MALKKYDSTPAQLKEVEGAFLAMTMREGWAQKFEMINEKFLNMAKHLYTLTPDSPEQRKGLEHLREAQMWFEQAIRKHEF